MSTGTDVRAVEPSGPIDATVALPGSKSITNRALVCAGLATGTSQIRGALDAEDTRAMIECLRSLGVTILSDGDTVEVKAGGLDDGVVSIDARQSGTTSRFLLPVLALDGVPRRMTGDPQLQVRPMDVAFDALRELGAKVDEVGVPGHLPAVVQGPLRGGQLTLAGDVSSQFLSGLLLVGPLLPGGLEVSVDTDLVSRPYVDMTIAVMRSFGAHVEPDGDCRWVVTTTPYQAADYLVEPDASAASYAFAAAVMTGGRVTVPDLSADALQGDVAFVDVLAAMGAHVVRDDDALTVGAGEELRGVDVDMSQLSDTVPTLAVVAACAESPTTIRNVGFIRHKESDRIGAVVRELRRCGIDARETDDGMVVVPGPLRAATIETYDDHRIAMAFALLGLRSDGIRIADPGCVAKTFPGYWQLLDGLRAGTDPPARAV